MNTVVSESVRLDRDVSWIRCITCDAELTRKLEDDIRRFRHFFWSAGKLYGKSHNDQKLAVIVSHPHGCFKQISIGQWVSIQSEDGHMHRFTYTACTCPGSSGGPVNIVGCDGHWGWGLIHSQALKSGQNRSGRGRRWEQFPTNNRYNKKKSKLSTHLEQMLGLFLLVL
ncbi:hypothetical protein Btru_039563 [Bulinus truncatus]|nr:hypothetical protein Btru_039563 [Bulinus truncatus]